MKIQDKIKVLSFAGVVVLLLFAAGCSKDKTTYISSASVNVVNAIAGPVSVKVNTGIGPGFLWSKTDGLDYGSSRFYASNAGTNTVTIANADDTTKVLFSKPLTLEAINTLYLIGTSAAVDTMLRVERNLPIIDMTKITRDNSVYIRFVNLSPNSSPVSVNIQSVTGKEVSSLPYKGISAFKKYSAAAGTADYIFEVRDAVTNAVLITYQVGVDDLRYKTLSLVLTGKVGGSDADALSVSTVYYYNNNN